MASMTRATLRAELIKQARIGSNVDTDVLDDWLYEAVKELQRDIWWLEKRRHYYVREYFSIGTDEGFGVILSTATGTINVIRSATAYSDITGSSMAQLISTLWESIVGDTGVYASYSTADRKFSLTIDSGVYNSTALAICPPSYDANALYDMSYKIFGFADGQSSVATLASGSNIVYKGDTAAFCTSEYPLPSDFLKVKEVRYEEKTYPLRPCIYKDRDTGTGTPSRYYIRGGYLGLTPQPTTGGALVQLDYYYLPADFSADASTHPFDPVFDFVIIYKAAELYKSYLEDMNGMLKFRAKYEDEKLKALQLKGARKGGAINMFDRGKYKSTYDPRRIVF